jgi:hypothetical protein
MSKFNLNHKKTKDTLEIQVAGTINEDARFDTLDMSNSKTVNIDLKDIVAINSCGVREWVKWIDSIPKGTSIQYRNVPSAIIDQMNMIFGFLPENARVDSFFVPYYCESCLLVTPLLINIQKDSDVSHLKIEDSIPCQKCKNPAELDILGAKYFKFLKKKSG